MAQISSDTKIKGRLDVQSQIAQTDLRYNVSEIDKDNNQSVCDSRKNVVVNGKSIKYANPSPILTPGILSPSFDCL